MNIYLSAAVLCAVTVCGAVFAAEEAAKDPAPEEQLTQVNAAISQIEDWLNSAANNRSSLETELRDTTQQIIHHVSCPCINRACRRITRNNRFGLHDDLAVGVCHAIDQERRDAIATIGKY